MPKASESTAGVTQQIPGAVSRSENFPGGWTVNFETETDDVDTTEQNRSLPNGQCQTFHLGYVIEGQIVYRTNEGDETFGAGDAYIVQPGHNSLVSAGTRYVEFSPTREQVKNYEHAVTSWTGLLESGAFPLIAAP